MVPVDFTYAAFISYRHLPRDAKVAKQVQDAIETYRVPRGALVGSGFHPGKPLGKCFRDEDELAAAHSLPESIVDALRQSSALVVVCSPETQESAWVQREIETYIGIHGQERVFCVLADGESQASIPQLLHSKTVVDTNGEERSIPAQPLAADLRAVAADKRADEKLRIIAAIAGCGFDDLRQRERSRKCKRIGLATAAAVMVAAVVGGFAWMAHGNQQSALEQESRSLAAQSQQLYERGDRYAAIQAALDALPASESDASRPLVPEAQQALAQALNTVNDGSRLWFPNYTLELDHNIVRLVSSPAVGWFATLDESGQVRTYETITSKPLATCALPIPQGGAFQSEDSNMGNWTIAAAGKHLVAAERSGSGIVACFDAATGQVAWSIESATADALVASGDGKTVDLFTISGASQFAAGIDVATGNALGVVESTEKPMPDYPVFLPACIGERANVMFAGVGPDILKFTIDEEHATLREGDSGQVIWSLLHDGETLLTASSNRLDSNFQGTCTFQAYDSNLQPLWNNQATWSFALVGQAYDTAAIDAWPRVWAVAHIGRPAFVCSAGSTLRVLACDTGEVLLTEEFSSPVVGAGRGYATDNSDMIFVACADGSAHVFYPRAGAPLTRNNGLGCTLPCAVDQAQFGWIADTAYTVVARDALNPRRVISYYMDSPATLPEDEQTDYSLDELIALANQALEAAGQGAR